MSVQERIRIGRIIEKIEKNKEYSEKIGIRTVLKYRREEGKKNIVMLQQLSYV